MRLRKRAWAPLFLCFGRSPKRAAPAAATQAQNKGLAADKAASPIAVADSGIIQRGRRIALASPCSVLRAQPEGDALLRLRRRHRKGEAL